MILPLFKLGTLAIKTLSKPIASRIKNHAAHHPKFRNFIVSIAQARGQTAPFKEGRGITAPTALTASVIVNRIPNPVEANHRITTTMQRRIHGHATNVEIRPLNEESAVQAAVDLLGELIVFSVGVGALIFEVQRNARSEAKKEEIRRQEMEALRKRDEDIKEEVELLKQKLAEIEQMAKGRGLAGVFHFKNAHTEGSKPSPAAT